jgi:uncharacterized membrane protein
MCLTKEAGHLWVWGALIIIAYPYRFFPEIYMKQQTTRLVTTAVTAKLLTIN